jgi:hypothetical protein
MRVAIYARVSTDDKGQDPENQLRELRAWCSNSAHTIVQAGKVAEGVLTSDSNSPRSWTPLPGESLIAFCFGLWTGSAEKAWRRR